jgi:bifunctional DNA-binding transcriptional regulator/antitoxin component of YhaV-PrlF toxin-antitoxin module
MRKRNEGRVIDGKANLPYRRRSEYEFFAMSTLKVTAKGQVTFRRDLLRHLGVRAGDVVDVEKLPGGRVELKAPSAKGRISAVFGLLKRESGAPLSIEELNELAAKGWSGER